MASSRLLLRSSPYNPTRSGRSPSAGTSVRALACLSNASSFHGDLHASTTRSAEGRPVSVSTKAAVGAAPEGVLTVDPWWTRVAEVVSELVADAAEGVLVLLRTVAKSRPRKLDLQMIVERGIINCRFFTCLAVVGTLLGSVLCFVEGCFMVLESYVQYFRSMSHVADQGHIIQLLIEALDMFLVGTAMLIFGASLHVMFVGSKANNVSRSSFFGLYNLSGLPRWVEKESVSQAKSKIGHAVMIILQVGMLDKFKNIPVTTSFDIACFAGAVLLSSACTFVLSRLSVARTAEDQ